MLYYIDRANNSVHKLDVNTGIDTTASGTLNPAPLNIIGGTTDPAGNYYVYSAQGVYGQVNLTTGAIVGGAYKSFVPPAGYVLVNNNTGNGDFTIDSTDQAYVIAQTTATPAGSGLANGAFLWKLNLATGALTSPVALRIDATTQWTGNANGLVVDPATGKFFISSGTGPTTGAAGTYNLNPTTGITTPEGLFTGLTDLGGCPVLPDRPTVTKSFSPSSVVGTSGTTALTINLNNSNLAPIYLQADFLDNLPNNMVVATPNGLGGTCNIASNTITAAAASSSIKLAAGSRIPAGGCTITVNVTATGVGNYVNTLAIGTLNTTVGTNASAANATFTVLAQPTLNLTKTIAAPGRHVAADQFTVQIKNGTTPVASGTTAGTGTTVTGGTTGSTTLTAGTTYTLTEIMVAGTSALSDYTTSIACTNSNGSSTTVLPSGAGQSFSITPNGNDVIGCTLTNTPKQADLQLTKSNSMTSILTGTNTTYTIRVTNGGPTTVTGAVFKDAAATGLSKTAVTCSTASGNTCTTTPPTATVLESGAGFSLPTLASSAFYEILVTANVTATSGSVVNTATVDAPTGIIDPSTGNNTASDTDTVTLPYTPTTPAICSALPGYTGTGSNLVTDFNDGTFGISTSDPVVASTNTRSPAAWPYPAATLNYGYAQVSASGPADGSLSLVNRLSSPRIYNTWSNALTAITVTGTGTGIATSDATTGRFLLINGANPGVTIIQTTISGLTPYTNYQLLGLFSNVIDNGQTGFVLPNIDFYVNGASYFRTGNIPQDVQSTWRRAGFVFNSGNATSATFKLVSRVPASTGNDLAFDQLSLNQCQGVYVNTLSGFLYGDANVSGSFQNPAEPQLPAGVIVDLQYTDSNGNPVTVAKTTTGVGSDTGKYVFTNVPPPPTGYTYFVHVEDGSYSTETTTIPAGYTLLSPNNAAIAGTPNYVSGTNIGPDFGFNFADLGITKSNGVTGLLVGSTTTYTIRVTNNGSISVTGAVLKDAAATGLSKTAVSCSAAAGNACTTAPTAVSLESGAGVTLPALARGAFYEINVTASVTATAGITVTNTATIAVPAGITDTAAGNNSASDSDLISAASTTTLTLSKTGAAAARPNGNVVYTLTVTNTGSVAATLVNLTDTIPANTTMVAATDASGTAITPVPTGSSYTWALGSIPATAGNSKTVTLTLKMPSATVIKTAPLPSVTNAASVSASNVTGPVSASAVTNLVLAELTKKVRNLTVATTAGPFGTTGTGLPKQVLEYCIDFQNYGGADLPNFVLTDAVPANVQPQLTGVSAAPTYGYDTEANAAGFAGSGYGVKLTRVSPPVLPATTPTTVVSYLTSASGSLTNVGGLNSDGTPNSGLMTVNLGTLTAGKSGTACFRSTIR